MWRVVQYILSAYASKQIWSSTCWWFKFSWLQLISGRNDLLKSIQISRYLLSFNMSITFLWEVLLWSWWFGKLILSYPFHVIRDLANLITSWSKGERRMLQRTTDTCRTVDLTTLSSQVSLTWLKQHHFTLILEFIGTHGLFPWAAIWLIILLSIPKQKKTKKRLLWDFDGVDIGNQFYFHIRVCGIDLL